MFVIVYAILSVIASLLSYLIFGTNVAIAAATIILIGGIFYTAYQNDLILPAFLWLCIIGGGLIYLEVFVGAVFKYAGIDGLFYILTFLLLGALTWSVATYTYGDAASIWVLLFVLTVFLMSILSAWVPFASQKAQDAGTQVGVGEKTAPAFSAITDGIADIWLMLTNPQKWAEERDNKKGKQEGSDAALEITSVKAMPSTVMPQDTYSLVFELENIGKNDATDVKIGAQIEGRAYTHNSRILGSDGNTLAKPWIFSEVGEVHPGEKRFESFDIKAPSCAGTFTTKAYVEYSYNAIATTNLELISRDYYDELLSHNKLTFKDQASTSSAGPFKLTIRTQYPQPIPVETTGGEPNKFKIYFNAINEREGQAYINDFTIELPEELQISGVCDFEPVTGSITAYHLKSPEQKDMKNRCIEPNDMTSYSCEFEHKIPGDIEKIKTLFLKTGIDYTFTYFKSAITTVKSNVPGYKTCAEEESIDARPVSELTANEIEEIKKKTLGPEWDAVFKSQCDASVVVPAAIPVFAGIPACITEDDEKAAGLINGLAEACYNTWNENGEGAKNDEISCGKFVLYAPGACETTWLDLPGEVRVSDNSKASISWSTLIGASKNRIDISNAVVMELKYIQKSCTLQGLKGVVIYEGNKAILTDILSGQPGMQDNICKPEAPA